MPFLRGRTMSGGHRLCADRSGAKTGTIWMPSLMHGAINAFTIFAYMTKPEYADKMILGPAHIGIISMIPLAALSGIICIKKTRDKKDIHRKCIDMIYKSSYLCDNTARCNVLSPIRGRNKGE